MKISFILQNSMKNMLKNSKFVDEQEKKKEINKIIEIFTECKENGIRICKEQIIRMNEILKDDILLDNMKGVELNTLCEHLKRIPLGSDEVKRIGIRKAIKKIRKDDKIIMVEGVKSMSYNELIDACKERRMLYKGLSKENLEDLMEDWLDLSINHKVSILLLLYYEEN